MDKPYTLSGPVSTLTPYTMVGHHATVGDINGCIKRFKIEVTCNVMIVESSMIFPDPDKMLKLTVQVLYHLRDRSYVTLLINCVNYIHLQLSHHSNNS